MAGPWEKYGQSSGPWQKYGGGGAASPTEPSSRGGMPLFNPAAGAAGIVPGMGGVSEAAGRPSQDMTPDWYGFTPGNIAANLYGGAKGAIGGIASVAHDLLSNPNWAGGPGSTLDKFVTQPALAQHAEANQLLKQGRPIESFGHELAANIPLVGPWAAGLGEQAGTGDIGGAAAQLGGATIGAKGTAKVAGFPLRVAGNVISKMGDEAALAKGMDITGKLVKNADRGANVSQGLLGVYQGKIVPTLAAAVERVKAPMNAAWEQYKQVAQAAQGDTKVPGTALLQRADKFMDEHPGISDNARTFYNKAVERLNPQSIESLNRLKGVVYKLANGKGTPGIDAKFYNEIYHGINDALKEHAESIGAGSVLDDAMKHSKAYYDLKHGLVDGILDNPAPRQGEHISMLNDLFAKDGEVARSISKQLHDPVLARNYGLSDLGDAFDRNLAYANQLYKGLSSYAKGFSGLFKSAADHPVAALTAYELLRSQNWIVRLVGVSKVAHMMNALEAGNALRTIRGEITDPMAFQEGFARGTAPKTYGPPTPKPPSGSPAAPDMPRGPLTPEERATWASKAKPVGADVLRGTGGQPVTYGTSEEMLRGLRKALGQETPEAKRAFEASEAKKAAKSKEK